MMMFMMMTIMMTTHVVVVVVVDVCDGGDDDDDNDNIIIIIIINNRCTNLGRQVVLVLRFWKLAPTVCGSSLWKLLLVAFLALRWHLDYWRICALL